MPKRLILLLIAFISLNGCSILSFQSAAPEQLLLLPPSEGPHGIVLKQKVTMSAQGERHQFIAVIRLEEKQLKLRALLPTGQAILSIDYDGHELTENNHSSLALPSEEILAMMQFALWSTASIEKHYLRDNGWQFKVISLQRVLKTSKGKVVSVDYLSPDELLVKNYPHDYQVRIETLEKHVL